jgi:hypothetical protein
VAWSKSAIFRAWLECALAPMAGFAGGWNLPFGPANQVGAFHCSLWIDQITPDETAPVGQTGLTTGQWAQISPPPAGNGMDSTWVAGPTDLTWPLGGPRIPGTGQAGGFTSAGGLVTFGGGSPVSAGPCTMGLIVGDMVFHFVAPSGTVNYQGVCFHYYGGEQRVTDGTFTVIWPPEGIAQLQLI